MANMKIEIICSSMIDGKTVTLKATQDTEDMTIIKPILDNMLTYLNNKVIESPIETHILQSPITKEDQEANDIENADVPEPEEKPKVFDISNGINEILKPDKKVLNDKGEEMMTPSQRKYIFAIHGEQKPDYKDNFTKREAWVFLCNAKKEYLDKYG